MVGPSNTVDGKMLNRSLYVTCKVDFPELEDDAKFLDEFEVFFLRYKEDTTPAFNPTILKFQRVYDFEEKTSNAECRKTRRPFKRKKHVKNKGILERR